MKKKENVWTVIFQLAWKRKLLVAGFWIAGIVAAWLLCLVSWTLVLFLSPLLIFIFIAPFLYFYALALQRLMIDFAEHNGLAYSEGEPVEGHRGRIFEFGQQGIIINLLQGVWNNFPIKVFHFQYLQKKERPVTVMEIIFRDIQFPSIFLRSNTMLHYVVRSREENISIQSGQFSLSATKGYEIEALQIFSEELMEYLSKHGPNFSIEFAGNQINIYEDKYIKNRKDMELLFEVGKHVIDSSGSFIARLSDDFAALHPYYSRNKNKS